MSRFGKLGNLVATKQVIWRAKKKWCRIFFSRLELAGSDSLDPFDQFDH